MNLRGGYSFRVYGVYLEPREVADVRRPFFLLRRAFESRDSAFKGVADGTRAEIGNGEIYRDLEPVLVALPGGAQLRQRKLRIPIVVQLVDGFREGVIVVESHVSADIFSRREVALVKSLIAVMRCRPFNTEMPNNTRVNGHMRKTEPLEIFGGCIDLRTREAELQPIERKFAKRAEQHLAGM